MSHHRRKSCLEIFRSNLPDYQDHVINQSQQNNDVENKSLRDQRIEAMSMLSRGEMIAKDKLARKLQRREAKKELRMRGSKSSTKLPSLSIPASTSSLIPSSSASTSISLPNTPSHLAKITTEFQSPLAASYHRPLSSSLSAQSLTSLTTLSTPPIHAHKSPHHNNNNHGSSSNNLSVTNRRLFVVKDDESNDDDDTDGDKHDCHDNNIDDNDSLDIDAKVKLSQPGNDLMMESNEVGKQLGLAGDWSFATMFDDIINDERALLPDHHSYWDMQSVSLMNSNVDEHVHASSSDEDDDDEDNDGSNNPVGSRFSNDVDSIDYSGMQTVVKRFIKAQRQIPSITEQDGRLPEKQASLPSSNSFIIVTKEYEERGYSQTTSESSQVSNRLSKVEDRLKEKKSRLFQPKIRSSSGQIGNAVDMNQSDNDGTSAAEITFVQKLDLVITSDGTKKQIVPMVPQPLITKYSTLSELDSGSTSTSSSTSKPHELSEFTSQMIAKSGNRAARLVSEQTAIPVFAIGNHVSMHSAEGTLSPSLMISPLRKSPIRMNSPLSKSKDESPDANDPKDIEVNASIKPMDVTPGVSFLDLLASAAAFPIVAPRSQSPISDATPSRTTSPTFMDPAASETQYQIVSISPIDNSVENQEVTAQVETFVDNTGQFLSSFSVDEYKSLLSLKQRTELEEKEHEKWEETVLQASGVGSPRRRGLVGVDTQHYTVWKPTGILTPYIPDQIELTEDHKQYVERQAMLDSLREKMIPPPSLRIPSSLVNRGKAEYLSSSGRVDEPLEAPKPNSGLAAGIAADASKRKAKYQREINRILGVVDDDNQIVDINSQSSIDNDNAITKSEQAIMDKAQAETGLKLGARRISYVPQPAPETIAMLLSRSMGPQAGGRRVPHNSSRRGSMLSKSIFVPRIRNQSISSITPSDPLVDASSHDVAKSQQIQHLETDIEKALRRATRLISFTLPALRYGVSVNANKELTSMEVSAAAPVLDRATVNPLSRDTELKNLSSFFWKEDDDNCILEAENEDEDDDDETAEGGQYFANGEFNQDNTWNVPREGKGDIGSVQSSLEDLDVDFDHSFTDKPYDFHDNQSTTKANEDEDYDTPHTENEMLLQAQASLSNYLDNALLGGQAGLADGISGSVGSRGSSTSSSAVASPIGLGNPNVSDNSKGSLGILLSLADEYIAQTIPAQGPEFHSLSKSPPVSTPYLESGPVGSSSNNVSRRASVIPTSTSVGVTSRRTSVLSGTGILSSAGSPVAVAGIKVGNFRRKSSIFSAITMPDLEKQHSPSDIIPGAIPRAISPSERIRSPSIASSDIASSAPFGRSSRSPAKHRKKGDNHQDEAAAGTKPASVAKTLSRHEAVLAESSAGAGTPVVFVPRPSMYSTITIQSSADEIQLNNNLSQESVGEIEAMRWQGASGEIAGSKDFGISALTLATNRQAARPAALWQRSTSPPNIENALDGTLSIELSPNALGIGTGTYSPNGSATIAAPAATPVLHDTALTTPFPRAGSRLGLLASAPNGTHGSGIARSPGAEPVLRAPSLGTIGGVGGSISTPTHARANAPHVNQYDWATHAYRAGVSTPAELAALTQQMEAMIQTSTTQLESIQEQTAKGGLLQKLRDRQLAKGARKV